MSTTLALPIVTEDTFNAFVAPGTGLVAIEFSAEWCPPCKVMAPVVEAIAQEYASRLRLFQMDGDASAATMARYGVRGLPTMLIFRDGELVDRIAGAVTLSTLRERIERVTA